MAAARSKAKIPSPVIAVPSGHSSLPGGSIVCAKIERALDEEIKTDPRLSGLNFKIFFNQGTVIKASLTQDDRLAKAIELMNEWGFRHVVLRGDGPKPGLVGGRDILLLIADYYPETLLNLPPRLHQTMTRPEGG